MSQNGISNIIDISTINNLTIFIEYSSHQSNETYDIEVSNDGSNYHRYHKLYPYDDNNDATTRNEKININVYGLKYLRIINKGTEKQLFMVLYMVLINRYLSEIFHYT